MDRRGFLRALGLGAVAAVAPTKTYAFFGSILRPRPVLEVADWREAVRVAHIDRSLLIAEPGDVIDAMIRHHNAIMARRIFYGS